MQKFIKFYDHDSDSGKPGVNLPPEVQECYGSDLMLPGTHPDRAVASSNFVATEDGIISLADKNDPNADPGGGPIAGNRPEDRALMAVLRAAHDAVLVGSGTLNAEPQHLWTARFIFPEWADLLESWREERKGSKNPINIIVSRSGEEKGKDGERSPMTLENPVFNHPDIPAVLVTTPAGQERLSEQLRKHPNIQVLAISGDPDDFEYQTLVQLKQRFAVDHVLIEGGPTLFGDFHFKGLITDMFTTQAPGLAGRTRDSSRPSLMMGREFKAGQIPRPTRVSLRQVGDHLFYRTRYQKHRTDQ